MRFAFDDLIDSRLAPYADEARAFRALRAGARGPRTWDELKEARAQQVYASCEPPPAETVIDSAGAAVPLRIFTPVTAPPRGVVLDIHGGGFYMGSANRHDARNRKLTEDRGFAVVSVDYRLAPEHPWPAAPDDCEAAALWLIDCAESMFGTDAALLITGVSAG